MCKCPLERISQTVANDSTFITAFLKTLVGFMQVDRLFQRTVGTRGNYCVFLESQPRKWMVVDFFCLKQISESFGQVQSQWLPSTCELMQMCQSLTITGGSCAVRDHGSTGWFWKPVSPLASPWKLCVRLESDRKRCTIDALSVRCLWRDTD